MSILDFQLILLVNIVWGFNFIAGKYGADHFNPLFFTSLRFFILLLLTLPWLKPAQGQMKPLLIVAFLMGVLHFGMIFLGIHASPDFSSGGKLMPKVKKSRINRFLDATYFDNEALKRDICLSG